MARSLAPRVSSRLLAAATVALGGEWSGYLQAVASSLVVGGPLPQAPVRWPLKEVEMCLEALLTAVNKGGALDGLRSLRSGFFGKWKRWFEWIHWLRGHVR